MYISWSSVTERKNVRTARRSRDASSRYSIDTLFPGLSNNSTHACNNNTAEESCIGIGIERERESVGSEKGDLKGELIPGEKSMAMAESAENGSEVEVGTDGDGGGAGSGSGSGFPTPAAIAINSPSSIPLLVGPATATAPTTVGGGSGSGRKRNQNNNGSYNGATHKGRQGKRGSVDRLVKEGKSLRSCRGSVESSVDNNNGVAVDPVSKLNSVGSRGSPSSGPSSSASSSSTNGKSSSGRGGGGAGNGNSRSTGSNSNNNSGPGSGRKRAGSPLKPTTIQAKQMSLLSTTSKMSRKSMYEGFRPWILRTYGDSAKTKTITKKKYCRIVKTLRGEEINNAENSKFRFWVKAKGFHIGPPPGHPHLKDDFFPFAHNNNNGDEGAGFGCFMDPELYVPTTVKDGSSIEKSVYKRVAVVEYFFDIIYTVHVETEAKNGKHAGQKRTYRAITEKNAFLPREAVTKFLLQCVEFQKRGSPGGGGNLPITGPIV